MSTNGGHKIQEAHLHAASEPEAQPPRKRPKFPPVINYLGAIPISITILIDAIWFPRWYLLVPLTIAQCITWWFGCLTCWFAGQAKGFRKDYS